MRTIFKTKLDVCDFQIVEVPQDFRILHLAMQDGTPCIWYECTSDMPLAGLKIYCFGTGFNMDGAPGGLEHIGSVVIRDGFVWHYYRDTALIYRP